MSVTRTLEINDFAPAELAEEFCDMDAKQQAEFFAHIGLIAAKWPGAGWCQQCCSMSEHFDKSATDTIAKLAEWAAEPYVSPVQS